MAAAKIRRNLIPGKLKPAKSASGGQTKKIGVTNNRGINHGTMFQQIVPSPIDNETVKKQKNIPVVEPVFKPKKGIDGTGMVVAILDTGIADHVDLDGKIIQKINGTENAKDVTDIQGHGTHIAGIIAGSQSKVNPSICGIAPGAKILSIKITVGENDETALWRIADGLEQISKYNSKNKKNKVTTIVICYNAFDNVGKAVITQHHRLSKLVTGFHEMNIPVICSGGNNYDFYNVEGLAYPAYLQNIIACGAMYNMQEGTNQKGTYTEFAQRIAPNNKIFGNYFLWAPGYRTISTGIKPKNSYTEMSGSSQAAAVIAGSVLLIQQKFFQQYKKLPAVNQIIEEIKKSA